MELVVGEQLHAAFEIAARYLYAERRSARFVGRDRIQLSLIDEAVARGRTVSEQVAGQRVDALFACRLLDLRVIVDVAAHRHGVCRVIRLHDDA